MNTTAAHPLLPLEEDSQVDERKFVNPSLWFVDRDGYRVVFYRYEPLYRMTLEDRVHVRFVAVSLRQSQLATQEEIAQAFGHTVATQRRWERAYQQEGAEGLMPKRPTGRHVKLTKAQEACVRKWFHVGIANVTMAQRLGVGETTIRRVLKRLGLRRVPTMVQQSLPVEEQTEQTTPAENLPLAEEKMPVLCRVPAEEVSPKVALPQASGLPDEKALKVAVATLDPAAMVPMPCFTLDRDPLDRSLDRACARLGLLEDAAPLFADAEVLPHAGVLLAVPLLERLGLVETFHKAYGSLHPSFYGLRTIVVTLFLYSLLRIKRPEHLKEYGPVDLGRIVGLDRAPEVKTVRRKLSQLAERRRGKELMKALAQKRIAQDQGRVAFLYLDGHVREYYGKHRLFQAKKAQRQVVAPAATDTWVNDARGEPLLVVTSEVNAQLTQVLEPILADVRRLLPEGQRVTVIFDRGGFSAKLFARLIDAGFDVISYRKGKLRKLPRRLFSGQRQKIDGIEREYEVYDRPRARVGKRAKQETDAGEGKYLWMREVRVQREDGRQTPILTNRQDLTAVEVAYRMFNRWRQENYFKYMGEEFALDALAEYGAEEVAEGTDRRNPAWLALTRRLKKAKAEVAGLQTELGEAAAANVEVQRPTMRGFKIAHAELRGKLEKAEVRVQRLMQQRKGIPNRIAASDLKALKTEKKLIVDAIKMAAYQVETELLGMLAGHYARTEDEGRTLLHAAFKSPARLEMAAGELRVTIAAQSSPHRTAALAALCAQLDVIGATFPGTNLRLRLTVATE
jgi:prepilin-type processing-associated H-X9-DG protein